jgi:hypothetical protein
MAERKSVWGLIAIPAVITLGITILRLIGELAHWSALFFNNAAGGGAAIVGITWLPIFFGPWFAVKLAEAGDGPEGRGKAIGFALLGTVVFVGGGVWLALTFTHFGNIVLVPFALMLIAAFIPGIAWPALGRTLLAYGFAARIPVLVVMFFAMRGSWGTHYDAVAPIFANSGLARKFVYEALLPQMTLWIGWTVCVGALLGTIFAAVKLRNKANVQTAA